MKFINIYLKSVFTVCMIASSHASSAPYSVEWPTLVAPRWSEVFDDTPDCLRAGGCRLLEYTVATARVHLDVDPSTTTLYDVIGLTGAPRGEMYTQLTSGVWWNDTVSGLTANMTLTEAHAKMSSAFPSGSKQSVLVALSGVSKYVCSGISLGNPMSQAGQPWAAYKYNRYFGGLSGDESCTNVPPQPDEYCAMATSSISMDYGTLTSSAALNATKTASVKIECSSAMKYVLRLPGRQDSIHLSNGMEAVITANSKALGSTLDGVAGSNNTVTITSKLTGTPITTGSFSGSSVLGVEYP